MTDDLGGNTAATFDTFEQAFAADASPAPDSTSPTDTHAPVAVEPAAETTPRHPDGEAPDDRSPFIPRQRFDEVNNSLRELKQWREQHAWAEQVQPAQLQQLQQFYQRATSDTRGFALQLLDELANHPDHAAAVRSELARRLGTRQQQAAPPQADDLAPDVQITDANGNVVGRTYSDAQVAKLLARHEQQIEQKFAPQFQTLQQIQQERQQIAVQQQAQHFGTTFAQELAKLPLFNEHKADIAKALRDAQLDSDHPAEVRAAAYQAYHRIVGPKLAQGNTQSVVADLQRKAAASSSVNPGTAATSMPKAVNSFHELPREAW